MSGRSVNTWGRATQIVLAAISFLALAPEAAATWVPWALLALYAVASVPIALPFLHVRHASVVTYRFARLGLLLDIGLFGYTLAVTGGLFSALVIFPSIFLFRVGLESESFRMYLFNGGLMLVIFSGIVTASALQTAPVPLALLAFVLYQYLAAYALPVFSLSRRLSLTATTQTLQAVRAANARLAGQLDLSLVLDELISSACEYTGAGSGAIVMRGENGRVRLATSRGIPPGDLQSVESLRNDDPLFSRVFTGTVRNLTPAEARHWGEEYAFMRRWQSVLACPLLIDGSVAGLLAVGSDRANAFSAHHRQFIEAIASEAGSAMRNAMVHERTLAMSQQDDLTRLYNSRRLRADLDERLALAAALDQPLSFLMLDLDTFKQFNDRYGHQAGDEALRVLGAALQGAMRPGDVAYRYGGEEFSVLMPATDSVAARQAADAVRQAVNRALGQAVSTARLTVSIGVASFPEHAASARELVLRADQALYAAKAAGRDRVVVFNPDATLPAAIPEADPGTPPRQFPPAG